MDWNSSYLSLIKYLKLKNYSPETLRYYRGMLKPFKRFLEEKMIEDVRQVTKENIREYLEIVHKEKISSSTNRSRIDVLKNFYKHLDNENVLLINPCEGLKTPKKNYLPRNILTVAEVKKLLKQPNTSIMVGIRNRAILELLYSTGIRVGECEALTIHDVDLKERILFVRHGKGNKDRVIPIGREAIKWIAEYKYKIRPKSSKRKRDVKNYFLAVNGSALRQKMIRGIVNKYVKEANIKKKGISCHSLRHTFATELIRNGADIVSVQRLLGHRNINSTLVYTRVMPVDIKKTHTLTHPGERNNYELKSQTKSK